MPDDAPKSAFELAMQRLRQKDKEANVDERPLTDAQKAAIAEVRQVFTAKTAEREILHRAALRKAATREEVELLNENLRRDLERMRPSQSLSPQRTLLRERVLLMSLARRDSLHRRNMGPATRQTAVPAGRRPATGVRRGPPGCCRAYRAGRYWALTAGAFCRAATHWPPFSSGVVLAARTAPPAAIARATAAIVTSSAASTITETSYSPYE